MNVPPDVYICPLTKKSAPCLPAGTVECIYTSGSITSSQRMLTEINESDTIAKIKISVESDTVKHLKAFRIISYEMPISFLIIQVDDILVVCIFRYFFTFI